MDVARPNREPLVAPGQIEHHVADLSATFSADVTLAAAQAKLREHGQWLPIDGDPQSTLGELVERNSTGPLRLGFGAWRDLLLGVQFRNGSGELITAGGRTVKNVAGYDLTKFMVGQYGIFGQIVTLTTRAYKVPDSALLATFEPNVKTLNALLLTPCRPQWAVLTKNALLCGYLGDGLTVDFYEENVPQHGAREMTRHQLDDDIAARETHWRASCIGNSFRASIPPARIGDFIGKLPHIVCTADAAFGIVVGECAEESRVDINGAAAACLGTAIVFDGAGRPKTNFADLAVSSLIFRLKHAFDPEGKLVPPAIKTS